MREARETAGRGTGVFMLSLDTELAWGTPRMTLHNVNLRPFYEKKREVVDALLCLLEKYGLKATWAVVGHLFLTACAPEHGRKHPEILRPHAGKGRDWFDKDPCTSVALDPIWYGPDIVKRIHDCRITQEIGCHTFSHIDVGESECTEEWFDSELTACRRLAEAMGVELRSFVFPRNKIGHLETLRKHGFSCYRGKDEQWFIPFPRPIRRVAHVFDNFFLPWTPAVSPRRQQGLWHIPGSYFYSHRLGWASWLPVSFRVRKIRNGITRAMRQERLYHLWFHPFTLATDPDLLKGLEEIFAFVAENCARGRLRNLTMGEMAAILSQEAV